MRYSLEHVSAKAKATHHAYLLQVSPLCRESTYESTKQILAEQKELRSALKYLKSELAVMIRDKTVSFMLSKQEREPLL
jgi:trans-2-enoyl-CoA reductase